MESPDRFALANACCSKHDGCMASIRAELGSYLKEQRQAAELSLRQLANLAEISNPYLSQIERGLKKPSAEILQSLAKGLKISAESLYVRAGMLAEDSAEPGVRSAILADSQLDQRQQQILLDVYQAFCAQNLARAAADPTENPTQGASDEDPSS